MSVESVVLVVGTTIIALGGAYVGMGTSAAVLKVAVPARIAIGTMSGIGIVAVGILASLAASKPQLLWMWFVGGYLGLGGFAVTYRMVGPGVPVANRTKTVMFALLSGSSVLAFLAAFAAMIFIHAPIEVFAIPAILFLISTAAQLYMSRSPGLKPSA